MTGNITEGKQKALIRLRPRLRPTWIWRAEFLIWIQQYDTLAFINNSIKLMIISSPIPKKHMIH